MKDEGCGIKKEHLEDIFTPFFTTKAPGEGTGLGLAIAHTIIQEHQGSVRVDRHPTLGGARFLVRLPQASIIAK